MWYKESRSNTNADVLWCMEINMKEVLAALRQYIDEFVEHLTKQRLERKGNEMDTDSLTGYGSKSPILYKIIEGK